MSEERGHGEVGKVESPFIPFTQMLGPRSQPYDADKLAALAMGMIMSPDGLSDGPDPEENLYVPAGYTYFGQFIDHDLTLDITSTLNPEDLKDPSKPLNDPSNLRSPRFDLDCVYGNGPGDQPYMYAVADDAAQGIYGGATMIIDAADLARAANGPGGTKGRAIIGDKRNDENSIVNQIQQTFIRFHNKVVAELAAKTPALRGGDLFKRARDEVRWAYQRIVLDDFLPRIVQAVVIDNFKQTKKYELYPEGPLRRNLPREFVAAAYRFGHSGVRTGYRLQGEPGPSNGTILPIFKNPPAANVDDSLVGFDPLPARHVIDHWARFFPGDFPVAGERPVSNVGPTTEVEEDGSGGDGKVRLQYAYKFDPSLTDPLANLPSKIASQNDVFPPSVRNLPPTTPPPPPPWGPSLALLNLLRGSRYLLRGGEAYAPCVGAVPLDPKYLRVRQAHETPDGSKQYSFTPISELVGPSGHAIGQAFKNDTPLWFYILAEAQKPVIDYWLEHGSRPLTENELLGLDADGNPMALAAHGDAIAAKQLLANTRCSGTQLGAVGGRIVVEVFYGLMESDPDSVFNSQGRKPAQWQPIFGGGAATMAKLLRYVNLATAPA